MVVQLVRAPACHAGSCEFDPRPSRSTKPLRKAEAFLFIKYNLNFDMKIIFSLLLIFSLSIPQNDVCFEIQGNPNPNNSALSCFSKYVNVLDCFNIYAESSISDEKVLHVAAIAAELLDNDEDGIVDDELILETLQSEQALMPIFTSDGNACMSQFENNYNGDGVSAVLWRNEIDPSNPGNWGDDATVEEVLHTINHVGHVNIYPNTFSLQPNSSMLSEAMDIARGGQFLTVPQNYPDEAWYHYDDWTCDYECMAIEYLYWSIVSYLGILDSPQTCNGIDNEWELCTPELFESTDVLMYSIIANQNYKIPQSAPDGNYCPLTDIIGDVNGDETVNIQDAILTINVIIGELNYNESCDVNDDGMIDILDVVQIINFILYPR